MPRQAAVPAALALLLQLTGTAGQQRPAFRAATDVILIEAHVLERDGTPRRGLTPDQFTVTIGGSRRPVLSADFIAVGEEQRARVGDPAAASATAPSPGGGRTFVIAVDQGSFPTSARASAREAARRVVEMAGPDDEIALVAYPGSIAVNPTRDRARIREAIDRIAGLRADVAIRFKLSASDVSAIRSKDGVRIREIVRRECGPGDFSCPEEVMAEARSVGDLLETQGAESISGLHGVLDALEPVPGRKHLILISAGVPFSSRPGGRPDLRLETLAVGRRAAAANVNLHVFYMNVHFMRLFSAEYAGKRDAQLFEDIGLFASGLESVAEHAGGAFYQVEVDADPFIARFLRETSGYYQLAVASMPAERDGDVHHIRVSVRGRGLSVRHRRTVIIPKSSPVPPQNRYTPNTSGFHSIPSSLGGAM